MPQSRTSRFFSAAIVLVQLFGAGVTANAQAAPSAGERAGSGTVKQILNHVRSLATSATAYGGASDEPEVDEFTGYIYNGCFAILEDFSPFSSIQPMDAMTRRTCSELCGTTGAAYSGVMEGDLCGCGSVDNYLESERAEGECLVECTGDDGRTEFCGGTDSFDLFEIFYQNDDA